MFAYVGCRTSRERNARGRGIGVFRVDSEGGWTALQVLEGLENPSYLILDAAQRHLYCVHGDLGEVSAFAIDEANGTLSHINTGGCGGRNPVHLVFDDTGQFLIVANFATGTLGMLPVRADGGLATPSQIFTLEGTPGPHRHQQKGMHPHQVIHDPSGRYLLVPDKGGDQVHILTFDSDVGHLAMHAPAIQSRSGAAPRHMVFHPTLPVAYLVNELDSTLATYCWDAMEGNLSPLQILPSIPQDFTGENTGAGIAVSPCGRFLYSSNRGHDSLAIFGIDPASGWLQPRAWQKSGGEQPRFFAINPSGRFLYAANENSDTIECFELAGERGLAPVAANRIAFGSPTCIAFKTP